MVDDYVQAVVNPAKAMAMSVIDLLYDDAQEARRVLETSPPTMTTQQYLAFQNARLTEELYVGE